MSTDLKGRRFGRLLVVSEVIRGSRRDGSKPRVRCLCDCTKEKVVDIRSLLRGSTRSCGCLSSQETARRNMKHGMCGYPEYQVWEAMWARCRSTSQPNYGGRGIYVDAPWSDFGAFIRDMGRRPRGGTLERVNNSQGYSPSNCVWATREAQNNNKRTNVLLTFRGETKTVAVWSKELNLRPTTVYSRVLRGLPAELCLSEEKLKC